MKQYPEIPNVSLCFCPSSCSSDGVYLEGEGVPGEGSVHQSGPDWPRVVPLARAWTALLRVLREVLLLEGTASAGGEAPGGLEVPHRDHRTMLWWNVPAPSHCWSVQKHFASIRAGTVDGCNFLEEETDPEKSLNQFVKIRQII